MHKLGILILLEALSIFILLIYLNGINPIITFTGSFLFLISLLSTLFITAVGVIALRWVNKRFGYAVILATAANLYAIYQSNIQYFVDNGLVQGWLSPPYVFGIVGGLFGLISGFFMVIGHDV